YPGAGASAAIAASSSSDGSQYNSCRSGPSGTRKTSIVGSYVTDRTMVPSPADRRRFVVVLLLLTAALAVRTAAQAPPPPPPPPMPLDANAVRLHLRVFDGTDDVTKETRVRVFPAGQRTDPVKMILGGDQAYEAEVPVGLYDVQAIRERAGEVSGV